MEGARAVGELVSAGATLQTLVVSQSYGNHIKPGSTQAEELDRLIARAGDVLLVGDQAFRFLAETVTPQGIGAVLEFPKMPTLSDILPKASRLLILENLQDPGNLGTCIRTADAFGFDAVLCVSDCVDAYNPKVLRSTVGSMFHIPVLRIEEKGNGYKMLSWQPATDNDCHNRPSYVIYASDTYPVDTDNPKNIIAQGIKETSFLYTTIFPWEDKHYFAVTAVDRYGNESEAIQASTY